MNPLLDTLQSYPFEKLKALFADLIPPDLPLISFGIGEPQHASPACVRDAIINAIDGLSHYPATQGSLALRQTIAHWLIARYRLSSLDPDSQVLPTLGSREALFAIAQAIINAHPAGNEPAIVLCPNPFYQIYEGAALLAGAQPYYINRDPARHHACDYASIPAAILRRTQLLYVCSPDNPTGAALTLDGWREIFTLADHYGFVIAADECYSEIYPNEAQPPIGALQAAEQLGRGMERLVIFSSLSKRSNVPGLRSGFIAGDPVIIRAFLRYRAYHGCAMSPMVQAASIAAWQDETHVRANREQYRAKFRAVIPLLTQALKVSAPDAAFYLWINVSQLGVNDITFARRLMATQHVSVLPGSYLARDTDYHGAASKHNPGEGFIRIALVADQARCLAGAQRIVALCQTLQQ